MTRARGWMTVRTASVFTLANVGAFTILFLFGGMLFSDVDIARENPANGASSNPVQAGGTSAITTDGAANPSSVISAESYLVADVDTGGVYAEKSSGKKLPIASITKIMTALVASKYMDSEQAIPISSGNLRYPQTSSDSVAEFVTIGALMHPLLMESNNAVAHTLADFYGTAVFIGKMNETAKELAMTSTAFADPSGQSAGNVSTVHDLFLLVRYIVNEKSSIFDISRMPSYTLITASGTPFVIRNFNVFWGDSSFIGGKVGRTTAAGETMVSIFSEHAGGSTRRIAILVLRSKDYANDTRLLRKSANVK